MYSRKQLLKPDWYYPKTLTTRVMKATRYVVMAPLLCLLSCFQGDHATPTDDANDAAGTGDPDLARQVVGVWMLSTDYNYQERCNYLPVEFVESYFKLPKTAEPQKYDSRDGCEIRWDRNRIGFSFEGRKSFESTFQSEYVFNKKYQPQVAATADATNPTKAPYTGPVTQGVGAETAADTTANPKSSAQSRYDRASPTTTNIPATASRITTPAVNTATGVAIAGLGDKAIWEPGRHTLHVLYNNHILHVYVQMPGRDDTLKDGAIGLAKVILDKLNDPEA